MISDINYIDNKKNEHELREKPIFDMIRCMLIDQRKRKNKTIRILNIGSGPVHVVSNFVSYFMPFCCEIVLLEPNHHMCEKYDQLFCTYNCEKEKGKEWKCQIKIISNCIENELKEMTNLSKKYFDIIWYNHAIYYIRLQEIGWLLNKLNGLLIDDDRSWIIIGVQHDKDDFNCQIRKKIVPSWNLADIIRNNIKRNDFNEFSEISHLSSTILSKDEAFKLFRLFVSENCLKHCDWNPKCQIKKCTMIDDIIDQQLPKVLTKQSGSGESDNDSDCYIWHQLSLFFILKKKADNDVDSGDLVDSCYHWSFFVATVVCFLSVVVLLVCGMPNI